MTLVAHVAQNEPNYARDYPSNFAGCSFRDPGTGLPSNAATLNSLLKSLRANLNAQGLSAVAVLGPDGDGYKTNFSPQFFGDKFYKVDADPALSAAVGGICSHSYSASSALNSARAYAAAASWISNGQYPSAFLSPPQARGKDVFMTEYGLNEPDAQSGNAYSPVTSIEGVLKAARHLAGDLSLVPNNYWFWWRGWSNKAATSTSYEDLLLGEFGTTKPNLVLRTKVFYFLKKVWTAAPGGQGWSVRDMTSYNTPLLASRNTLSSHEIDMFTLANGANSRMVIVITNGQTAAQPLRLSGLAGNSALVYVSTATQDMAYQGTISYAANTANLNLPARSVTVLATR
jgi:O-glycosyl hydrolase